MADDLVRLSWRDTDELEIAEGRRRDGHAILPRDRAEELIAWVLGRFDNRFEFRIEPWQMAGSSSPAKETSGVKFAFFLGLYGTCLAFAKSHMGLIVPVGVGLSLALLAVLGIYLPSSHYRVIPVGALALGSFASGFLSMKKLESL